MRDVAAIPEAEYGNRGMKMNSFVKLFSLDGIKKIEIPIIQRDYAQGRRDDVVRRIRRNFLATLHRALTGGEPVSLDFVYGEVTGGKMIPLDGQQRLTTLFLLHWYIAARAGIHGAGSEFLRNFTYETRYSSRDFCSRLIEQRPAFPIDRLSDWIRDQSWFFSVWRHDPTIQSMLVVLDDIHDLFKDNDCGVVWQRLVDIENPAIVFHVLPIENMGLTDDLYIKMNSRGKPLTKFEHFKANFEKIVREVSADHYGEFINKIDNDWADLLWPLRGENDIIDGEFMRYFRFITDILIYRTGMEMPAGLMDTDIDRGAELVYGRNNPNAEANQRFLFDALNCWLKINAADFFEGAFAEKGYHPGKVTIYDAVNLFAACCKVYGSIEERNRRFSLPHMLLLFAVIVHLTHDTEDFSRRIRIVRNLIFSSENEIRLENLKRLLEDTRELMVTGDLRKIEGYNQKQVLEELNKADFFSAYPELQESLFSLEDHILIRGCVAVFEFDASAFAQRVTAFHEAFSENDEVPLLEVSAALLACGDYSQQFSRGRFQFGSKSRGQIWRQLFTNTASKDLNATKSALMQMLDALIKAGNGPIRERLRGIVESYLDKQTQIQRFDWRYYLVRYDEMREGKSGIYVGSEGVMGFSLCMLDKERLSSYYRDPYLYAVFKHSGAVLDRDIGNLWYTGYDTEERWMKLVKSGAQLTCRKEGFSLSEPTCEAYRETFAEVIKKHNVDNTLLLQIPQVTSNGVLYDTIDRVQAGALLVRDLTLMAGTSTPTPSPTHET
jgi:hypothetical protein